MASALVEGKGGENEEKAQCPERADLIPIQKARKAAAGESTTFEVDSSGEGQEIADWPKVWEPTRGIGSFRGARLQDNPLKNSCESGTNKENKRT